MGSFARVGKIWMCILLVVVVGQTLASDEAMSLFAQGIQELNAGHKDTALETFKRVTTLAPDFADAHYHLGWVYYQQAEFRKAIDAFTRTLQLLPRDVDALIKLGLASHKAANVEVAADTETRRAFYEQAVEAYKTALDIRPHNIEALNNLGLAYRALGRFEEAIQVYQEGLTLNPEQPQLRANLATAYEHLAWIYFNLKRFEDAIRAGKTVQTLRPNPQVAQLVVFASELKAGKYPFETYQLWDQGRRASAAGKLEAAVELLSQAIAVGSEFAPAYNTLAWLYADKLPPEQQTPAVLSEAERLARRAHALDPDATHIYDTLGWVLYKQGRYAEALAAFEQALARAPNSPEYLYHGSLAALKNGQISQTLKYLSQAVAVDKRYGQRADAESEFEGIRSTPAFRRAVDN